MLKKKSRRSVKKARFINHRIKEVNMAKGKVEIIAELCKACGYCIKFCPKQVLAYGKNQL